MLKDQIRNELLKIGFNPIHLGTTYLIEGIYICIMQKRDDGYLNLEKDVYTILSKKYNKNVQTIKSNIVKSTNYILPNTIYLEQHYCFLDVHNVKLTPKLVMKLIIDKLR